MMWSDEEPVRSSRGDIWRKDKLVISQAQEEEDEEEKEKEEDVYDDVDCGVNPVCVGVAGFGIKPVLVAGAEANGCAACAGCAGC